MTDPGVNEGSNNHIVLYKASDEDIDNSNRQEMIVIKGDVDSNSKLDGNENNNYDTELLNAVSSNPTPPTILKEPSAASVMRNNKQVRRSGDQDTLSSASGPGDAFISPQFMNT